MGQAWNGCCEAAPGLGQGFTSPLHGPDTIWTPDAQPDIYRACEQGLEAMTKESLSGAFAGPMGAKRCKPAHEGSIMTEAVAL